MFPLYDHTRRQICIAAFFGLCVVPTLTISSLGIARHLPSHKYSEEQRLSQELGVDVSIDSMAHTLPGVVRYTGLKLTDPETGQELFRCAELLATWTSMTDSSGQTRPALKLAATQAESANCDWNRLHEVLRRRLECQSGRPEIEIRLTCDQWTLHSGNVSQILESVEGGVGLISNGIQAQLWFRLPGIPSSQRAGIRIVRNRQVSPPADGFNMDTRACPIPCSLLATYFKELCALGPNCCFSGDVSTQNSSDGWSGDLSGQLSGVDLGRLARQNGLPSLTGTADITLQSARFQGSQLSELTGRIASGPGVLGGDMLAALVRYLRFVPTTQLPTASESLPFDHLGLDFWINSGGITIAGHCANSPRAVAVIGGRAILSEPRAQPQTVAALISALVPVNEAPVPATRQTASLARLLPIPDAARMK